MKLSIFGIDEEFEIKQGSLNFLNIRNKHEYLLILKYMIQDINNNLTNEIVIKSDKRLSGKEICFINDLYTYEFNNKTIVDKFIKNYYSEMNLDIGMKTKEQELYRDIIYPIIDKLDLLEVDYTVREEIDSTFYSKFLGIDFGVNNDIDLLEKIIDIIKIETRLFNKELFVLNRVLHLLNADDLHEIDDFVRKNNVTLLFIDCLPANEVVIRSNYCLDDDYGVYKVSNETMI